MLRRSTVGRLLAILLLTRRRLLAILLLARGWLLTIWGLSGRRLLTVRLLPWRGLLTVWRLVVLLLLTVLLLARRRLLAIGRLLLVLVVPRLGRRRSAVRRLLLRWLSRLLLGRLAVILALLLGGILLAWLPVLRGPSGRRVTSPCWRLTLLVTIGLLLVWRLLVTWLVVLLLLLVWRLLLVARGRRGRTWRA